MPKPKILDVWQCNLCMEYNALSMEHCGHCHQAKSNLTRLAQIDAKSPAALELQADTGKGAKSGKKGGKQATKRQTASDLEESLYNTWQSLGTRHKLERQFVIHSKRYTTPKKQNPKTYKVDFVIVELALCIEVQGGQWQGGRHQRGAGYAEDRRRVRDLTLMGWTVMEFTTDDIKNRLWQTIEEIKEMVTILEAKGKAA